MMFCLRSYGCGPPLFPITSNASCESERAVLETNGLILIIHFQPFPCVMSKTQE